jgi:hypothetical protein
MRKEICFREIRQDLVFYIGTRIEQSERLGAQRLDHENLFHGWLLLASTMGGSGVALVLILRSSL